MIWLGLYKNHGGKFLKLQHFLKIRQIHSEFTAAIYGLIEFKNIETVFHSVDYSIFQSFSEWMNLSMFVVIEHCF